MENVIDYFTRVHPSLYFYVALTVVLVAGLPFLSEGYCLKQKKRYFASYEGQEFRRELNILYQQKIYHTKLFWDAVMYFLLVSAGWFPIFFHQIGIVFFLMMVALFLVTTNISFALLKSWIPKIAY